MFVSAVSSGAWAATFSMTAPLPHERAAFSYPDCLARARRTDRGAFAQLYEGTYRRVFGYLLARTGEPVVAEDLLQEVYLAALQSIGRFRGNTEAEFIGWLLKIAKGKAADRLRARYRHPEISVPDAVAGERRDPVDAVEERLQLREIASGLAQLTDEQREVVVSRLVLGLDLEETSKVMGKSVGSIKSLQHRALARLAAILKTGGTTHA